MRRGSILICAVFVSLGAQAGPLGRSDGIDSFLLPFIRKEVAKQGNSSAWKGAGNGGYVIRFDLDVTGDGRKEAFISCSLASSGSYADWEVMSVEENGEMRPYADRLQLSVDGLWVVDNEGQRNLFQEFAPSEEDQRSTPQEDWLYPVYRYSFSFPRTDITKYKWNFSEVQSSREQRDVDGIDVKVILLSSYLNDREAKWIDVDEWRVNMNDYFFVPGDSDKLALNSSLTPEVALSLIESTAQKRADKTGTDDGGELVRNDAGAATERASTWSRAAVWGGAIVLLLLGCVLLRRLFSSQN